MRSTRRPLILVCAAAALAGATSFSAEQDDSFPALAELEREVSRLVKQNEASVVSVVARLKLEEILKGMGEEVRIAADEADKARRIGSGVVIDDAGHIATTGAVVLGATDIVIIPGGGGAKRGARIRGVDPVSGIAILAPERAEGLKPVRLAEQPAPVGAMVTAFGNPSEEGPTYSFGFISGTGIHEGPFRTGSFMKINAPTLPGAAGGPLFDTKGRLVGLLFGGGDTRRSVIRWRTRQGEEAEPVEPEDPETMAFLHAMHGRDADVSNVSYAIPVDTLRHVAGQLIATGAVRRGWMGVSIESPEPGEVVLTRVVPQSPASKAGLIKGDRVVALDGERLRSAEALVERIARSAPGDVVRLEIVRGELHSGIAVSLAERPEPVERRQPAPRAVRVRRPLGVRIEPVEESIEIPGLPEGAGLVVLQVVGSSRAAQAGLSEGDILVEALGVPLRSVVDLRYVLSMQAQPMPVKVVRDGKMVVVTVPPPPPPKEGAPPPPRAAPHPPKPRSN